jgi:hypothetical protein
MALYRRSARRFLVELVVERTLDFYDKFVLREVRIAFEQFIVDWANRIPVEFGSTTDLVL